MGYRSDVKLVISKKGYDMIAENCAKSDKEWVRNMLTENTITETSKDNNNLRDDAISVEWNCVKWYRHFEDVSAVEDILDMLDKKVEENPELLDDYFYKLIAIGEDNYTTERTNDLDYEILDDFYVECRFSF